MKLHLLLLPLALAACSSNEPPANPHADTAAPTTAQETPAAAPMAASDATLARYHWHLTDATQADGVRIDELFVDNDKPVQLEFVDKRVAIRNTCNLMNGDYQLADGELKVEPIIGTLMACADPKLAALDAAVSNRLEGTSRVELSGGEDAPRLKLTTEAGETLSFDGEPTAANRYGGEGQQMFMEVAAQTVPCDHPLMGSTQCLQVRELVYDDSGIVSGKPGEWEPLHQDIEGYTHEAGVRNVVRVKRYTVENPPADGSPVAYVLDMVVESEQTAP